MAKRGKPYAGSSFSDVMLQQANKMAGSAVYCRYCGLDVKQPSSKQPEVNWSRDLQWEEQYHAHVSCHQLHIAKERGYRQ